MEKREKLGSRLGFILLSAGCAIGIGNVWRFPYITGLYGGGAFVLIYLFFLVVMGMPVMTMEFAVGRASKKSIAKSYTALEKPGQKWHIHSYFAIAGNYLLMMFYTTVTGWMLHYFYLMLTGRFAGKAVDEVSAIFSGMLSQPLVMGGWMIFVVLAGFGICSMGLQRGVEKVTKVMMVSLMVIMIILAINSIITPGSAEGLKFYLLPDFNRMVEVGVWPTIVAAMNQSFFTLSLGIGAMAIFGSYIGREHALLGESLRIGVLDTCVAIVAGLIIFPACFAFGIEPDSGPNLIFITLPNMFNNMPAGRIWGALFFKDEVEKGMPLNHAGGCCQINYDIPDLPGLHILPEGEYVCMPKFGMPYETSHINKLLSWVKENNYEIAGDIYEECLLDSIFYDDDNELDFCEIQIPIRKKDPDKTKGEA